MASAAGAPSGDGDPAPAAAPPAAGVIDLRAACARLRPAFFRIYVEHRRGREEPGVDLERAAFVGISGTLLNDAGYVLTVGDALRDAALVVVENERGEIAIGDVIGYDTRTNVGLVNIGPLEGRPADLALTSLVEPGLPVFALGNPFNLGVTMSTGHVTGLGRTIESNDGELTDLVQLSVAVNPGDQGGPVADADGRVIAMLVTRLWQPPEGMPDVVPQGISFGLPIREAKLVADELIAAYQGKGEPGTTPWLGVRVLTVPEALRTQLRLSSTGGMLIEAVFRGSPAEAAGLRASDVIVRFAGQQLQELDQLGRLIREAGVNGSVVVEIVREGEQIPLEVVIGSRP